MDYKSISNLTKDHYYTFLKKYYDINVKPLNFTDFYYRDDLGFFDQYIPRTFKIYDKNHIICDQLISYLVKRENVPNILYFNGNLASKSFESIEHDYNYSITDTKKLIYLLQKSPEHTILILNNINLTNVMYRCITFVKRRRINIVFIHNDKYDQSHFFKYIFDKEFFIPDKYSSVHLTHYGLNDENVQQIISVCKHNKLFLMMNFDKFELCYKKLH